MSRSKSKQKKSLPKAASIAPAAPQAAAEAVGPDSTGPEAAAPAGAVAEAAPEATASAPAPAAPEEPAPVALATTDASVAAPAIVAAAPAPSPASDPQPVASIIDEAASILTVDLDAIADNWRTLTRELTPVDCGAVVKADAYGCGVDKVVPVLSRAGCTTFFVADVIEARRVRAVAPDGIIYVFGGVPPGTAARFAECNARPVINSLTEFAEWDAFVTTQNWQGGAALHVDTGMNRLGLSVEEASAFGPRIQQENHGITLVMSHLITSEEPKNPLNQRQINAFREIRAQFRGVPASLANSSGIYLGTPAHFDLARPGVALYGGNPTPMVKNPMRPVVEMQARVAQIRRIEKGDTVGYNATWSARRPSRIATVMAGYSDGYLRSASGPEGRVGGKALVAGTLCPIVGRISMDLIGLDITEVPEANIRRGDLVTLIGGTLDVDTVAHSAGTISYEILTSLSQRHFRVYKGG